MSRVRWITLLLAVCIVCAGLSCSGGNGGAVQTGTPGTASGGGGGDDGGGGDGASLDVTVATTTFDAAQVLLAAQGAEPGALDATRTSILRGRVLAASTSGRNARAKGEMQPAAGSPLAGVAVTILDHPEWGGTTTGADGTFSIVVNGGGYLTVNLAASGFPGAQRTLPVGWQEWDPVPDVTLTPYDPNVTLVDFSDPVQVARGSAISDSEGARRATVLFFQGTTASMVLPDATTQPLASLSVRATEFTVGPDGPSAMPQSLPPTSGYTYATEFSVDEAVAAGATRVDFSQPVVLYLENFLSFPVGMDVPAGALDRTTGEWEGAPDGRVLEIVSVTGGLADLDLDGDGTADDPASLGITGPERETLAGLYSVGQELWRVPLEHFTPWDCNWPRVPPSDARPPKPNPKQTPKPPDPDDPCLTSGTIIDLDSQILGEDLPLTGLPWWLHYQTDRVPGRSRGRTIEFQVTDSSPPASLKRVDILTSVAGRSFPESLPPSPDQTWRFTWDGKDFLGRPLNGLQTAEVRVGFVYDAEYAEPGAFESAFANLSGVPISGNRSREEVTLYRDYRFSLGSWDASAQKMGAWTLDVHHAYDPVGHILQKGDGTRRSVETVGRVLTTVAGNGTSGFSGDGGPATQAQLGGGFNTLTGLAVGPDRSVYIADNLNHRIRRVAPDGTIDTVAGTGTAGFSGDGGPATQADLDDPVDVVPLPDGGFVISDGNNRRLRRVAPDGTIDTLAGGGVDLGEGVPGPQADIGRPNAEPQCLGPDGSLFFSTGTGRIRRVGPDGRVYTVAGTGTPGFSGDGGPALQARVGINVAVAVAADGTVYLADRNANRIRQVTPDGLIRSVAGGGGSSADGVPATQAFVSLPLSVQVAADGGFYYADLTDRIRQVGPDGIVNTVAGSGGSGFTPDGKLGPGSALSSAYDLALDSDGTLYFCERGASRVRKLATRLSGFTLQEIAVPSDDGTELYVFTDRGLHQRTVSTLTGATLLAFGYDANGLLTSVTDGDGNVTTLQRGTDGFVTSIVAPGGQATSLAYDANGYLASATDPGGNVRRFTSSSGGLLTSQTDEVGNVSNYSYDADGLLVLDDDAAAGSLALERTETESTEQVTATTALGRVTTMLHEDLDDGSERHTHTDPAGGQTISVHRPDGSYSITYPDGTTETGTLGPDPRWSMAAAFVASQKVRTPGGKERQTTVARAATLSDPADPLSLETLTDTVTVNARTTTIAFEASTRTFTTTTPQGRTRVLVTDDQGRPTSQQPDSSVAPVLFTWTDGLLTEITQSPLRQSWTYDARRRPVSATDALGQAFAFAFDDADRVVSMTTPGGRIFGLAYDAHGNVVSLDPPGGPATGLDWDALNLLARHVLPGGSSYQFAYDADRAPQSETLPGGRVVTASYDAGGRLTGVAGPETQVDRTSVGNTDRPASLTWTPIGGGPAQAMAYTWDGGLLTAAACTGPATGTVAYAFDNNFWVTNLTVLGTGQAQARDNDGLVTAQGPFAQDRSGPAGLVRGITDGTLTVSYEYDGLGRLSRRTHAAGATTFYDLQLSYDDAGRVSQKIETVGATTHTLAYTYDADSQLTGVQRDGAPFESYAWDANGNRTSRQVNGGAAQAATYDSQDRLLTLDGVTIQADADGFVTAKGADTFDYAAEHELLGATVGGQAVTYGYDGVGRVNSRTQGGMTTQFFYRTPALDSPLAASQDAGGATRYFHDESGALFAFQRGGSTFYVGADQVGTPKIVVNSSGVAQRVVERDSFGQGLSDSNPGLYLPQGFAGGLADPATGLVRFGARDYDPAAGRWMARDPLLFGGGWPNLYAYCANDPLNLVDRSGLGIKETVAMYTANSYKPNTTKELNRRLAAFNLQALALARYKAKGKKLPKKGCPDLTEEYLELEAQYDRELNDALQNLFGGSPLVKMVKATQGGPQSTPQQQSTTQQNQGSNIQQRVNNFAQGTQGRAQP